MPSAGTGSPEKSVFEQIKMFLIVLLLFTFIIMNNNNNLRNIIIQNSYLLIFISFTYLIEPISLSFIHGTQRVIFEEYPGRFSI